MRVAGPTCQGDDEGCKAVRNTSALLASNKSLYSDLARWTLTLPAVLRTAVGSLDAAGGMTTSVVKSASSNLEASASLSFEPGDVDPNHSTTDDAWPGEISAAAPPAQCPWDCSLIGFGKVTVIMS